MYKDHLVIDRKIMPTISVVKTTTTYINNPFTITSLHTSPDLEKSPSVSVKNLKNLKSQGIDDSKKTHTEKKL